jgi:hypothetical protein
MFGLCSKFQTQSSVVKAPALDDSRVLAGAFAGRS